MEENKQGQFKVTDDIIAKLELRLLNWILDIIMLIFLFLLLITIVIAVSQSYGNKAIPAYLIVNPIGQFTFITTIRLIYYIFLETLFGQTIGKFITKTIVVDENGERVTHEVILIRTLCRLIPFYEFSFFGIPSRGWHDSISKTYVVNNDLLKEKKKAFYSS
ncbi:MAG: RDD family protein [Bacteroidota bacterium]